MDIFIVVAIYVLVFLCLLVILYYQIRNSDREYRSNLVRQAYEYLQTHNTDNSKLSNIPIYIHTIPRLVERQHKMREQMQKLGYTNYQFYYGLDKNEMNLNSWTLPDGITRTIRVPSKERHVLVAHTLSMLSLMQVFYASGEPYMLLLEDDVSLCLLPGWDMSIQEMMEQAPSDWRILSLIPHGSKSTQKYKPYKDNFSCAAWIFTREAAKTILDTIVSDTEIDLFKFGIDIVADMSFPRIVQTYVLNKFYVIDYNLDDSTENMINPKHVWRKFEAWENDLLQAYNFAYLEDKN